MWVAPEVVFLARDVWVSLAPSWLRSNPYSSIDYTPVVFTAHLVFRCELEVECLVLHTCTKFDCGRLPFCLELLTSMERFGVDSYPIHCP